MQSVVSRHFSMRHIDSLQERESTGKRDVEPSFPRRKRRASSLFDGEFPVCVQDDKKLNKFEGMP